jgi:uncharacterized membrane protein YdjX (TVP38/TMEM64 family)
MAALAPAPRKKLLFRLGLALALAAAAAIFLLRGVHVLDLVNRAVALISGLGPWVFFTAMTLLPACGVPASVFTLTAGSAFAGRMGMGAVVACGAAATVINLAFSYWLARWVFRAWLGRLLERLGYKLPRVEKHDMTDLIVILRVTPGFPFCIQNYLLGLVDAPAGPYFLISCLTAVSNTAAFIVFGEALVHGKGRTILVAFSLIVALVAATHFLRRHYGRRKLAVA